MTVEDLVARFLTWIQRNRKQNTFKSYTYQLKPFREKFGPRPFETLQPLEIDDYLLEVCSRKDGSEKRPDTIRQKMVVLEVLQQFASKRCGIQKVVIIDLDKPAGQYRDRLPTEEELLAIEAHSSPEFKLMVEAFRKCGARPCELAQATVADWNRADGEIVLVDHKAKKKSKRPRLITVGEVLEGIILASLAGRTEGPLFLTPRGRPWTSASLGQTFDRTRKRAKVDPALKYYCIRHAWATAACETIGHEATAEQMGHADTRMLKRYNHTKKARKRANQDAVSV